MRLPSSVCALVSLIFCHSQARSTQLQGFRCSQLSHGKENQKGHARGTAAGFESQWQVEARFETSYSATGCSESAGVCLLNASQEHPPSSLVVKPSQVRRPRKRRRKTRRKTKGHQRRIARRRQTRTISVRHLRPRRPRMPRIQSTRSRKRRP